MCIVHALCQGNLFVPNFPLQPAVLDSHSTLPLYINNIRVQSLCHFKYHPRLQVVFSSKATQRKEPSSKSQFEDTAKRLHYRHQSEDGAVIRNIDACRTIAQTVQTSLGPYGRNKIVINHLQKMILTNDAATILRELEVVHPAAKLVVMASQQQEAEVDRCYQLESVKKANGVRRWEMAPISSSY